MEIPQSCITAATSHPPVQDIRDTENSRRCLTNQWCSLATRCGIWPHGDRMSLHTYVIWASLYQHSPFLLAASLGVKPWASSGLSHIISLKYNHFIHTMTFFASFSTSQFWAQPREPLQCQGLSIRKTSSSRRIDSVGKYIVESLFEFKIRKCSRGANRRGGEQNASIWLCSRSKPESFGNQLPYTKLALEILFPPTLKLAIVFAIFCMLGNWVISLLAMLMFAIFLHKSKYESVMCFM